MARRLLLPLLALSLAGPVTGQPAPPANVAEDDDVSAVLPSEGQIAARLATLAPAARDAIAGLSHAQRQRLFLVAFLADEGPQPFLTGLAEAPAQTQIKVIGRLARFSRADAENQAIALRIMAPEHRQIVIDLLDLLPPEAPYDPANVQRSCAALASPRFSDDLRTRCAQAAAILALDDEPQPAGPGMVPAPPGTAPWQAQLVSAGASARGKLAQHAIAEQRAIAAARAEAPPGARVGLPPGFAQPWEALHVCGAANLGGGWVLTAAHCIGQWEGRNAAFFEGRRIMMGSRKISGGGQIWRIDAVVRHGAYRAARTGDDIAMLRLAPQPEGTPIEPVTAIALPTPSGPAPRIGDALQVTGWGVTGVTRDGGDTRDSNGEEQRFSEVLRVGSITLRRREACNAHPEFTWRKLVLGPGQLCAGSDVQTDSCKGDSGGPLVWLRKGAPPQLVGLVSHGPGCGLPRTPAAYADVRHYGGWIAAARAQAQSGRIIDFVPGQCRHDGADVPCNSGGARP